MRPIGFGTGAVARGDFRRGLRLLEAHGTTAVEFSVHRLPEVEELITFLATERPASSFHHVSVHGPGRFSTPEQEERVFELLRQHVPPEWPVILHPDGVTLDDAWRSLGPRACFENMDRQKPLGKTCADMRLVFTRFPEATFCVDLGHARQIDPSMNLAEDLLRAFPQRLREVHCSEVDARGGHGVMSPETEAAFRGIAHLVPPGVPIILETDLAENDIARELAKARALFAEQAPATDRG